MLWIRRARQEHDAFADAQVDRGGGMLYLESLLADVLAAPEVRERALEQTLAAVDLGPQELAEWIGRHPRAPCGCSLSG